MHRSCDGLWFGMNKGFVIAGLCTLPLAVLFPVASFLFPAGLLLFTCNRFFTFSCAGDSHEDSLRFIRTLPYSREQVFETYGKGICRICLLYVLALLCFRLVLLFTELPLAYLWVGNLLTGYELTMYFSELTLFLVCCSIFLFRMLRNYTATSRSMYISGLLFLIFPVVFACNYLKLYLQLLSSLTITKAGDHISESYSMEMATLKAEPAEIISVLIVLSAIVVLSVVLVRTVRKSKTLFCGEGTPCLRK